MVVRPSLPVRSVNPYINIHLNATHLPPVKYQILNCQGKDILVGRLKIDTPNDGHAFILRRFDTGAVSLTTMFRAAFPNASDSEEKLEVAWVKDTYDLTGNNGSTKDTHITRLAGVWVGPSVALELGKAYMLGRLIEAVVEAKPDPNGNYRRSGKSTAATATATTNAPTAVHSPPATGNAQAAAVASPPSIVSKPPSAAKSLPTPSPTAAASPPTKRRKESSPAVEPQTVVKPPSRQSPAPSKVAPPPSNTLRRSARTKSPAPRQPSAPPPILRTPKATRSATKKESITLTTSLTPGGSDLTVVDEESLVVEDGVVGAELRDQDIKEQHKLIQDLKDKRDAVRKAQEVEEGMDVGGEESSYSNGKKREREDQDQPLKFDFKDPEKEERAISTNRRVGRFSMEPRTKSFAWGLAAFAVGMGAV
ncbi:hypothetical protein BYT27DRAFT_7257032 [Phlegmacium glaucopus]|nr:hypothetical protein BYT27DRAFT_7257032 [Phlegmacium glaucopus]